MSLSCPQKKLRKLMKYTIKAIDSIPDITNNVEAEISGALDRVGMEAVELPVNIRGQNGQLMTIPAEGDFFVSLDNQNAKGIHMSRLYILAHDYLANHELNFSTIENLLKAMVESHNGLSSSSSLDVSFDYLIERPALVSDKKGWRAYPVSLGGSFNINGNMVLETALRITYSSTCPCSAALARQLIQQNFLNSFSDKSLNYEDVFNWLGSQEAHIATPHSQRSYADIYLSFASAEESLSIPYIINAIENTLGTPVQTAVKREDEQEFARLNAANLMFSEDAARRIKAVLEEEPKIIDYKVKVAHIESLHPHDAVVIINKNQ
jgi:GTP cyclohydrolase I